MKYIIGIIMFVLIGAISLGAVLQHSPKQRDAVKEQQEKQKTVKNTAQEQMAGSHKPDYPCHSGCCNCEPEKNWWEKLLTDPVASFTGLLFVVTGGLIWMGWRQETMSRMHERAYVFGGGPYGFLKGGINPTMAENFPKSEYFSDEKRMTLHNYGRTVGYITSVEWGFYPYELYKEGLRVTDIIDKTILPRAKLTLKSVPYPGEVIAPSLNRPHLYRHVAFVRNQYIGSVFFGRIRYKDVFGDNHHSTFQLLLKGEYSEPLGSQYDDQT